MIPVSPSKSRRTSASPLRSSLAPIEQNLKAYLYVSSPPTKDHIERADRSQWFTDQTTARINTTTPDEYQTFTFDQIFAGTTEFQTAAYYSAISPLARRTIAGEDTVAVFCGPGATSLNSYLLSPQVEIPPGSGTVVPGLLSQAASQLLLAGSSVNGTKRATVTLSWFRVDCSSSEFIIDILKTASSPNLASSTATGIVSSSTEQLVLREQGRGRGMAVPGLWEVELAGTNDIEQVVNHVLKLVQTAAPSSDAHSVIQLTYSPIQTDEASVPASSGRLSFVILSGIMSTVTNEEGTALIPHPWVQQLLQVMDSIEAKHAAPAFHKSRLLLLLRDLICGRQYGCMMVVTPYPALSTLIDLQLWLHLTDRIKMKPLLPSSSLNNYNSYSYSQTNNSNNTPHNQQSKPPLANRRQSSLPPQVPSSSLANIFGQVDSRASMSVPDIPSRPRSPSVRSQTSPHRLSYSPGRRVSLRETLKAVTAQDRSLSPIHAALKRDEHPSSGVSYIAHEEASLLRAAFTTLQGENVQLRQRVSSLEIQLGEQQAAYQDLIAQLKEEGAMLEQKDQERFRKALQDLRDYEVYKEVMEAAMVRMTHELSESTKLNDELKKAAELQARRRSSCDDKALRELSTMRRRLSTAESKQAEAEMLAKKAAKERDATAAEQQAYRAEVKRRLSVAVNAGVGKQTNNSAAAIELPSVVDAKKRVEELEAEIIALNKAHKEEVSKLSAGHGNALEQLLEYQEENRLLKSTLAAMLDASSAQGANQVGRVDASVLGGSNNQQRSTRRAAIDKLQTINRRDGD